MYITKALHEMQVVPVIPDKRSAIRNPGSPSRLREGVRGRAVGEYLNITTAPLLTSPRKRGEG